MKYASAGAFRHALEHRLQQLTGEGGDAALVRQRKLMAYDRLVARLLDVAPERWVVKGGVALNLRLGRRARTTRDLDLSRYGDEEAAVLDLVAAQTVDLGDFFGFRIRRTDRLDAALEGTAVRYHIRAELAGRLFEASIVDVGFHDASADAPDRLPGLGLFGFAGIDPLTVPVLPLDRHIAEKLHAYARIYGGQRTNTRVKDLIDLVLIRSVADLAAGPLRQWIAATFAPCGTHTIPIALPLPPSTWEDAYRQLATEVGLDPTISTGHRLAAAFLDPVLDGTVADDARWNPSRGSW